MFGLENSFKGRKSFNREFNLILLNYPSDDFQALEWTMGRGVQIIRLARKHKMMKAIKIESVELTSDPCNQKIIPQINGKNVLCLDSEK
ncbi:hypothetical protein GBA52_012386 [Prunus armeniaca]|nr:hypothetical protein GBA52_012386 [Prunus armeniaca]